MAPASGSGRSSSSKRDAPAAYFVGSALAAVVNFPLWKASAMAQSGFKTKSKSYFGAYAEALRPPYRGVAAVVGGMTWARFAIFYGSDVGRRWLESRHVFDRGSVPAIAVPPLIVSTCVQVVNQPIIRASIMLQNPEADFRASQGTKDALKRIVRERGVAALWHGTSAGILKTVPKYCVAILIKEQCERRLPRSDSTGGRLLRDAAKAVAPAVAGAVLTNPLDVIRNEMFKTDQSLVTVVKRLHADHGWRWVARGADKNLVGVAVPVACTIFFTDQLRRAGL
jgi:hypothetical protein